ncbi:hypothetical protein EDD15DRAFT_2358868 [Pisolithus albus]|nr:hypothetical protein EDD15DRAFT_2358868 [Pisolithus albus]
MRRTLKKLIRARRVAWDKNREVRYRPNDHEFTWLARSTAAIDDFLEACQIDIAKYASLKASLRTAAKTHLNLGIRPQDQHIESLQVVVDAVSSPRSSLGQHIRKTMACDVIPPPLLESEDEAEEVPSKNCESSFEPAFRHPPTIHSAKQPPPYRSKRSSSRLSSPALSNADASAFDRVHTPPRHPNIPADDGVAGKDAVRQFLQLASPSLEAYVDAFIMLGVRDQASLQGFLSWPPSARVQWLNEENGILRMSRLEVGSFLLHCENTARRSAIQN